MLLKHIPTHININTDDKLQIKKLKLEIKKLRMELAMQNTLHNHSANISYKPLTTDDKTAIQQEVINYIDNHIDQIQIQSIRQINQVFQQFKHYIIDLKQQHNQLLELNKQLEKQLKEKDQAAEKNHQTTTAINNINQQQNKVTYVGEIDHEQDGFHIGEIIDKDQATTTKSSLKQQQQQQDDDDIHYISKFRRIIPKILKNKDQLISKPNQELIYKNYILEQGKEYHDQIIQLKKQNKQDKIQLKKHIKIINTLTKEIKMLQVDDDLKKKKISKKKKKNREEKEEKKKKTMRGTRTKNKSFLLNSSIITYNYYMKRKNYIPSHILHV